MAGHTHVGDTRDLINYMFAQGSSRERVAAALGIPIHYLSGGGHVLNRKFSTAVIENVKATLGGISDDADLRSNTQFQLP